MKQLGYQRIFSHLFFKKKTLNRYFLVLVTDLPVPIYIIHIHDEIYFSFWMDSFLWSSDWNFKKQCSRFERMGWKGEYFQRKVEFVFEKVLTYCYIYQLIITYRFLNCNYQYLQLRWVTKREAFKIEICKEFFF